MAGNSRRKPRGLGLFNQSPHLIWIHGKRLAFSKFTTRFSRSYPRCWRTHPRRLFHDDWEPVPLRRGELFGRFRKTTDEIVRLRSEFTVTLRNGFDGCTDSGRSDVTTHTTRWRVISLNSYRTRAWRRHGRTNRRAGNALVSQGERENTQLLGFNRFSKCLACVCEEYGISLKVESEAWTCQACPDCGDHEKTIRHKDTLTCLCGPEENANLRPSETLLREHSETELRPMARPVRFELDDRDWSETTPSRKS